MKQLFLEDLKDLNQEQALQHLIDEYAEEIDQTKELAKNKLNGLNVILAYESVGSCGCDSSSFFVLKNNNDEYFEIHGSHCSCYGFENQLDLEPTTLIALKERAKNNGLFYCGGYDENSDTNKQKANDFILSL